MSALPVPVRITRLETDRLPARRVPVPSGMRLSLMRVDPVPPAFYRFLYEQVGRAHHWQAHRALDDEAIADLFSGNGAAQLHVLSVDGAPGGFFEILMNAASGVTDIVHFGLMAHVQGRGLGRWLLAEAIAAASAAGARRVGIETNTLDHPRAFRLYQKAGFAPVSWREADVVPWD